MSLDRFRSVDIRIDKADHYFMSSQFAKGGDYNGRTLVVQITNGGLIESQAGITINLGWRHESVKNSGLDPFEVVDAAQGIFEISYPREMLNPGRVTAVIQIIDGETITETKNFVIQVEKSPIDETSIVSSNSFTVLQEALIKVNSWNARIDAVEADFIQRANDMEAIYPQKLNSLTSQLEQATNINYNIASVGLNGDGVFDNANLLQTLFNQLGSRSVFTFPSGVFGVSELSLFQKQGVTIQGVNRDVSVLRMLQSSGKKIAFEGCTSLLFRDLTFENMDALTIDKLIFKESAMIGGTVDIRFERCRFINMVNSLTDNGTVTLWKNSRNVVFDDCDFQEINTAFKSDNNFQTVGDDVSRFINCTFSTHATLKGKRAIRYMGPGDRSKAHVFIQNCVFDGFEQSVGDLYHIHAFTITGNTIKNCKAKKASKTGNDTTESGLFWLDTQGSINVGNNVFAFNTFNTIEGIPVYLEEVVNGKIFANRFINVIGRTEGVMTWTDGVDTLVSEGNHCIVVGGGVLHLDINGNTFQDVDRLVLIARKFSPLTVASYYTEDIKFRDNSGVGIRETGIDIMDRVARIVVKNNDISAIGGTTYPFIEYTKTTSQDLAFIRVDANTIYNFFKFYKRPSQYGNGSFINNYHFCSTASANFFEVGVRTAYIVKNNIFAFSMSPTGFNMIEA